MKRRQFLKYTSIGSASFAITACTVKNPNSLDKSPLDLGKLEKKSLILAYVPTTDAAPLIIAQEKGFFTRYGLNVSLRRQNTWEDIEKGLLEWQFDAAQTLYGMPMLAQMGKKSASMISLMTLNWHGSAMTLSPKVWKDGIRPSTQYINFAEFSDNWREYIRKHAQVPTFATDSEASLDTYLSRYWLAAMGVNPDQEIEWKTIAPSQLIYKLQDGTLNGYTVAEPYNQLAVEKKAGFVVYTSRDIWKGHPSKILATMQGWVDKHPTTARALVAAILETCQFCDQSENRQEIAQILSQSKYLNLDVAFIEPPLINHYPYEKLETPNAKGSLLPDFQLFHFRETNYLKKPDQVNYPWRSHGVWLLTQMIRWQKIDYKEYPKDADQKLDKIYPVTLYEEIAKGLNLELPSERMKKELASAFIDQREFDPSQPVAYLNQFDARTTKARIYIT